MTSRKFEAFFCGYTFCIGRVVNQSSDEKSSIINRVVGVHN